MFLEEEKRDYHASTVARSSAFVKSYKIPSCCCGYCVKTTREKEKMNINIFSQKICNVDNCFFFFFNMKKSFIYFLADPNCCCNTTVRVCCFFLFFFAMSRIQQQQPNRMKVAARALTHIAELPSSRLVLGTVSSVFGQRERATDTTPKRICNTFANFSFGQSFSWSWRPNFFFVILFVSILKRQTKLKYTVSFMLSVGFDQCQNVNLSIENRLAWHKLGYSVIPPFPYYRRPIYL